MAKDRHRVFEIYPSCDEAAAAVMPKVQKVTEVSGGSETWTFKQVIVAQLAGITHVRFKEPELSAPDVAAQIEEDFLQLADKLGGNSRVLLDFTGVESFGPGGINSLTVLNRKLQVRGSRMVLCSLEPNVRATFFPAK